MSSEVPKNEDYNYTSFDAGAYNLDQFKGPQLGDKAPDGMVSEMNGTKRRLLDFEGKFLVLEMGSITCPLFQDRRGGMDGIAKTYPEFSHAVLYVREAHPGALRPEHKCQADKQANAEALVSDGEARDVFVDDMSGSVHQAYGGYPNSVFIINQNGCVLWHSAWNDPKAVRAALLDLNAGRPARGRAMFKPARPWVVRRTMKGAGPGAFTDFLRGLPGLIWKNLIKFNLRQLDQKRVLPPPDINC